MIVNCADPKLDLTRLFRKDSEGGILAGFSNRTVYYSANARAAIRRVCDLLGLDAACEVLAPSYNCGSEIDPLIDAGVCVVLYDVDKSTNVLLDDLRRRITPRTRAIYVTHYFGFCQPQIAEIRALCTAHGLYLIEDCALALFGDAEKGAPGSFGDVAIFCFYKFFPVADGGALVINTSGLDPRQGFLRPAPIGFVAKPVLKAIGQHVIGRRAMKILKAGLKRLDRAAKDRPETPRTKRPDMPGDYYFEPVFRNARMSILTRYLLRSFNVARCIETRRRNFTYFLRHLKDSEQIRPLFSKLPEGSCPLSFPVIVCDRDRICAELNLAGIPTTPWWAGYHQGLSWGGFENARFLKASVLSLPSHQFLSERHVAYIAGVLESVVSRRQNS